MSIEKPLTLIGSVVERVTDNAGEVAADLRGSGIFGKGRHKSEGRIDNKLLKVFLVPFLEISVFSVITNRKGKRVKGK